MRVYPLEDMAIAVDNLRDFASSQPYSFYECGIPTHLFAAMLEELRFHREEGDLKLTNRLCLTCYNDADDCECESEDEDYEDMEVGF